LSLSRFVNLVYFHLVEWMSPEKRRELDRLLENQPVNPDAPPAWWRGDDDAAQSGLAVARALGQRVALN